MCDTVRSGLVGAIGAAAVVVIMSSTTSTRAAVGGPALTAVPCPDAVWQNDDPTFDALPGARASFGQYEGGIYRVEIPDTWNGELVLWAHGFVDHRNPQADLVTHARFGPSCHPHAEALN